MTIRNRYGSVTDELNFEDVKQYHTKCEKYDDATGEIVYAVDLYYLEADKNNVETIFNDLYTKTLSGTPISAETLRGQRKTKLKDSDWTVMPDTPLSDSKKAEWVTYRQALRDITDGVDTEEKALAVTWPTAPN
tara:strand:+ start:409 stop:810 length:402 start_codon:yes stop_codon:yes gene_type:complete